MSAGRCPGSRSDDVCGRLTTGVLRVTRVPGAGQARTVEMRFCDEHGAQVAEGYALTEWIADVPTPPIAPVERRATSGVPDYWNLVDRAVAATCEEWPLDEYEAERASAWPLVRAEQFDADVERTILRRLAAGGDPRDPGGWA